MKTKKIIAVVTLLLIVAAVGSCKKYRYCHCVTTEGVPDTMIVNIDRSMRCKHILQMDRTLFAADSADMIAVSCVELDDDTVAVILPRPEED